MLAGGALLPPGGTGLQPHSRGRGARPDVGGHLGPRLVSPGPGIQIHGNNPSGRAGDTANGGACRDKETTERAAKGEKHQPLPHGRLRNQGFLDGDAPAHVCTLVLRVPLRTANVSGFFPLSPHPVTPAVLTLQPCSQVLFTSHHSVGLRMSWRRVTASPDLTPSGAGSARLGCAVLGSSLIALTFFWRFNVIRKRRLGRTVMVAFTCQLGRVPVP